CSGLMQYVYARLGVQIPRVAADQYRAGPHVSRADLRPGDLVFFDHLGHVGMYVGGGRFIHAPHTGTVVEISSLSGWYSEMYVGATRVSGSGASAALRSCRRSSWGTPRRPAATGP